MAAILDRYPGVPWLYTGALENHPDSIDRMAATNPLLGISGRPLRRARDPVDWGTILRRAGFRVATVVGPDESAPRDELPRLLKPIASGGGLGIVRAPADLDVVPAGRYLQERLEGISLGVAFLADGSRTRRLGVTRMSLARSDGGLRTEYRGCVGPWPVTSDAGRCLDRIGETLAEGLGLRGLFGIDVVVQDGVPIPIEINPRYTASIEVIEETGGASLLGEHARVWGVESIAPSISNGTKPDVAAKRIVFARRRLIVPEDGPWPAPDENWPAASDIPRGGTVVERGEPVLTARARGRTAVEAIARLRKAVAGWRREMTRWELRAGS